MLTLALKLRVNKFEKVYSKFFSIIEEVFLYSSENVKAE